MEAGFAIALSSALFSVKSTEKIMPPQKKERILVTGGGGFIGSHLAKFLHHQGHFVRLVDLRFNGYDQGSVYDEKLKLDLREWDNCLKATEKIDHVYNLAANMGGIAFITEIGAEIMRDNILINTYMLEAARQNKVSKHIRPRGYLQGRKRKISGSTLPESC